MNFECNLKRCNTSFLTELDYNSDTRVEKLTFFFFHMEVQETSAKNYYSVKWNINNFSFCWQKQNEVISSPIFSIYIPEETKWKLLLFPRGTNDGNSVSLFLHREQDCNGAESLEIEYYLDLLISPNSIYQKAKIKHTFRKDSRWGYPKFLNRKLMIEQRMKFIPQDILTLRCRITHLDKKSVEIRQIFAETTINIEKKSLLWDIQEFSSLTPNQKKWCIIKSPSNEELIKIELFPSGGQCFDEKINLNIYFADKGMKYFTLHTFLLNLVGSTIDSGQYENWCEHGKCLFPLTYSRNQLIISADLYLPNDTLSLGLEFSISTGFAFEGVTKIDFGTISHEFENEVHENWRKRNNEEKITENSCSLINDLTTLYQDESLSDMKVQTKTNIFPVHTSILCARSPVFKAMFSVDMKEKLNGSVDMSHLEDEIVHRFLLFLYTNKLEELKWEEALSLYEEADRYAIISLKDQCSLFLKYNLNMENVCRILMVSDIHQDVEMKHFAQDFILKNANEIFKSEEWKLLENANSKLALETLRLNWIEK